MSLVLGDTATVDRDLLARLRDAGEDVAAALVLVRELGATLPLPGGGRTLERWAVLAEVAAANLTVARVLEAHADALAIVAEAGEPRPDAASTWGVFAAEDPRYELHAEAATGGAVVLRGTKPWCSLGGELDAALVTAEVRDGQRRLFRVDLHHAGVTAHPAEGWVARGLRTVVSVPITFDDVPAYAVGEPGWYLRRDGFAWGGIGVAACWYGGAWAVGQTVLRAAGVRPNPVLCLHAGTVDTALTSARAVLEDAARRIDGNGGRGCRPDVLALRARSVVAQAAETAIVQAGHALGPAPLAFDAEHAGRVADLQLYVRQHHAERDLAALGQALVESTA